MSFEAAFVSYIDFCGASAFQTEDESRKIEYNLSCKNPRAAGGKCFPREYRPLNIGPLTRRPRRRIRA